MVITSNIENQVYGNSKVPLGQIQDTFDLIAEGHSVTIKAGGNVERMVVGGRAKSGSNNQSNVKAVKAIGNHVVLEIGGSAEALIGGSATNFGEKSRTKPQVIELPSLKVHEV